MNDNRPISMWGYFGYEILFSLPLFGWICALVLSFTSPNVNVRNFARSYFCKLLLVLVLLGILFFFGFTYGVFYELLENFAS